MRLLNEMNQKFLNSGGLKTELFNFLDFSQKDKDKFKEYILENVPKTERGYMGFKEKRYLKKFLNFWISKERRKTVLKSPEIKKVEYTIENALKKISSFIGQDSQEIYIIPAHDNFVRDKMEGVMGACLHKKIILIEVSDKKGWRNELKDTLAHETAHAISKNYFMFSNSEETKNKMKVAIIAEGLAEHFKENLFRKKRSLWTKAFSKDKTKRNLQRAKPYLNKKGLNAHQELFFGKNEKFVLWFGYTLGYHLVSHYLENLKNIKWKKLLRSDLEEIFNKSVKLVE